jgi:hypothetical protein
MGRGGMTNQELLERIRELDRLYLLAEQRKTPEATQRYLDALAKVHAEIDEDERRQTA